MNFRRYVDLEEFYSDTILLLTENEIQNNLIIGNLLRAKEAKNWNDFLMGVITDNAEINIIVMQTPPYPILIYEVGNKVTNAGLALIVDYLIDNNIKIPGIVSEKGLAERFTKLYQMKVNCATLSVLSMQLYRLDEVKVTPHEGLLRKATNADMHFLPYWHNAFVNDCNLIDKIDYDIVVKKLEKQIENGVLYIFETDQPVSQVAAGRKTLNGIVLNAVYTPPYFRKTGYATNMMAYICKQLLNEGYKFCALFADLSNPISNSVYLKVGFVPVILYDEIRFSY